MQKKRMAIAVAIALAGPCAAYAQQASMPDFRLSAFGTLGAVSTSTDLAEYATSVLQSGGAKKKADFGVDSILAGQLDVSATKDLSFTVQAVANRTADDDYKPHVEWAFARYAITADLAVRGGILAAPLFLQSDSRLVGFANPWVRTPTALYSQSPLTNFRGVDLVYRHAFADVNVTFQPYFGDAPTSIPAARGSHVVADLDHMRGVNLVAEMGPWTARAGYMQTQFTYPGASLAQLLAGMRSIDSVVPGAAALAARLEPKDKKITFSSVGAAYDRGNVLFQGEYARRKTQSFFSDTTAWYASLAYRFGNVMPHVTLSRTRVDSATTQSVIPSVGPLAALADPLNGVLTEQNVAQKTVALGVRWQFAKNADVKLQWDRVDLPVGAVGNFQNFRAGFPGSTVNVYSAAVDFVF